MKAYTLEELKAAQAKGCRIEYKDPSGNWVECLAKEDDLHIYAFLRIHPEDVWKARLPRLKEGAEWACDGNDMPNGVRPPVVGEVIAGFAMAKGETGFTRRPIPPEFLHPDELAKTWCPMCAAYTDHGSGACPQLAKQPEAAQAPDFGEPWEPSGEMIFDHDGDYVAEFQPPFHDSRRVAARAIACVNALRGVRDPAEFVRQAKENASRLADIERRQQAETIMQNHLDSHL
jgi:hypothetical protein